MASVLENRSEVLDSAKMKKQRGAYVAVLVLSILYFIRPEDFIKPLAAIHLGRITGVIALIALVFGLMGGKTAKLPRETKLMLLLFAQLSLCVPFAYWIGGSINVITDKFSKAIILGLLVTLIVTSFRWLRQLIFLQTAAIVAIVVIALLTHSADHAGRLSFGEGLYTNANDFALIMAISLPFCLAFLLSASNPLKKVFWGLGTLALLYGVVATYSRSGFLAASFGVLLCFWDFAIKGRRMHLVVLVVVVGGLLLVAAPGHYFGRISTIFTQEDDPTRMSGSSLEKRRELFERSLNLALHHPIFGVGPGNFQVVAGDWAVAHNTYTELASEAGFPALLIFLFLLRAAYLSVRRARQLVKQTGNKEFKLLAGALWASLAAYTVGAFFADTAYQLYLYFLLSYMPVFCRIVEANAEQDARATLEQATTANGGESYRRTELAWMRSD